MARHTGSNRSIGRLRPALCALLVVERRRCRCGSGAGADHVRRGMAREKAVRGGMDAAVAPPDPLRRFTPSLPPTRRWSRRYPASSYSDDALWQAGRLALDAFGKFGERVTRTPGSACSAACRGIPDEQAGEARCRSRSRARKAPCPRQPSRPRRNLRRPSACRRPRFRVSPWRSRPRLARGTGCYNAAGVSATGAFTPRFRPESRPSRTSAASCCPTRSGSSSSSTPRCRSTTSASPIRRACSSICREPARCRHWWTRRIRFDSDADLGPPGSHRPAPEQHDARRARRGWRDQLQRLSALQPVPAGHRLRSRRARRAGCDRDVRTDVRAAPARRSRHCACLEAAGEGAAAEPRLPRIAAAACAAERAPAAARADRADPGQSPIASRLIADARAVRTRRRGYHRRPSIAPREASAPLGAAAPPTQNIDRRPLDRAPARTRRLANRDRSRHGGHDPGAKGKGVDRGGARAGCRAAAREAAAEGARHRRHPDAPDRRLHRSCRSGRRSPTAKAPICSSRFTPTPARTPQAHGIETYFLNFANNLSAAAVAARENAASTPGHGRAARLREGHRAEQQAGRVARPRDPGAALDGRPA